MIRRIEGKMHNYLEELSIKTALWPEILLDILILKSPNITPLDESNTMVHQSPGATQGRARPRRPRALRAD